ncbi:ABC transporter ATP-binding protein [Fusobacterium varium]|uniref:ABC transporter ATP-binding protein n=2 Tax=Fusobacterium varium TaxID=856 RepID=A0ABN5JIB8_FUSVA|nr:ABC transporter ATP-binding protein [Fusobacterium varium ATCC 27725]EES64741.2 ABC transporter, ATP-binding protein [Fusobacterium varium ATCC 27725]VEH37828.1 Putative multidrug export ATP-binding/permease protein SAV1866 [Fusobacterium varium]
MFKFFKPFIPKAILAALFKMGEAFCDLSLPLIMAKIIDIGVSNKDLTYITKMGGTMVGIALIGYICSIFCNYFSVHSTQNFGASLRDKVFTKIQSFNFVHLNKFTQASLITRMTKDVDQIMNMFLMCIRMVLRGLVTGIGAVIMAVTINPVLAILFIFIVPTIVGTTMYYMKKSFGIYAEVQKKLDNLTLVMRENLTGIRVIRALSKEKIEAERFKEKNDDLKLKTIEADNLMASKLPFITLIMNIGVVAVLWFGGIRVNYGKMHLGEVVAFINYLNMLLFSMNALSFLFTLYSRTAISYRRVKEVLFENIDNLSEEEFEKIFTDTVIEFKNVSFSYDNTDNYILENINLKIKRGENIGIIGGIGSGKTSLIALIPKFYEVTKGEILIDGVNVNKYKEKELRNKIGIVMQKSFLFSQSIEQNIKWGKENASDEDVKNVVSIVQGKDFVEKLPNQYKTEVTKGGTNFSGGQKQRLSIARTLIKEPEILIFDDSFSALDFITEYNLKNELKNYLKNTTILTISQRVASLMKMDRIIVMDNGKVVGFDSHAALAENCEIYREICESQEICIPGGNYCEV